MKRKLIYLINIILLMLVSGIFWGTWLALIHSPGSLSSEEFLHIGKMIISNIYLPIRMILIMCIIMMLPALWFYRYKKGIGFYLGLASFFCIIATLIITLGFIGPLESRITGWTISSLPPQWEYIRDQWTLFYTLATLTVLISFGCFSWFILAAMKKNKTANY